MDGHSQRPQNRERARMKTVSRDPLVCRFRHSNTMDTWEVKADLERRLDGVKDKLQRKRQHLFSLPSESSPERDHLVRTLNKHLTYDLQNEQQILKRKYLFRIRKGHWIEINGKAIFIPTKVPVYVTRHPNVMINQRVRQATLEMARAAGEFHSTFYIFVRLLFAFSTEPTANNEPTKQINAIPFLFTLFFIIIFFVQEGNTK